MKMNYKMRRENARAMMKKYDLDCLLVTPSSDLYYLTGYRGIVTERLICLIITNEGDYFLSPQFELDNLNNEIRDNMELLLWSETQDPIELLRGPVSESSRRAAIGGAFPGTVLLKCQKVFPGLSWEFGSLVLNELRMVKSEEEAECLKEAGRRSQKAFLRFMEHGIGGLKETEAAALLMQFLLEEGLNTEGPPIAAAGDHSAAPHHINTDRVIKKGDPVIFDFGGGFLGYVSDITRTVVVEEIPEGFQEIYDTVKSANEAAFAAAAAGISCEELDRTARGIIERAGYGQYFTHRLGHGLGLEGHEEPFLVEGNRMPIREGFVFTIEPGIYLPGRFGVRIEDDVIIRDGKAQRLLALGRKLPVIC